ncbi:MAG: hypothetical protein Q9227_009402, partial [Pyrenula ochraceoflavens]
MAFRTFLSLDALQKGCKGAGAERNRNFINKLLHGSKESGQLPFVVPKDLHTTMLQSSVGLFSIPSELRNRIYEGLLSPNPDVPVTIYIHQSLRPESLHLHPAILCTCKQIYSEALPILYARNQFNLDLSSPYLDPDGKGGKGVKRRGRAESGPLFKDGRRGYKQENATGTIDSGSLKPFQATSYQRIFLDVVAMTRLQFPEGIFHAHIFTRLHHITILTTPRAVWAGLSIESFYILTGCLLLDILRTLSSANDDTQSRIRDNGLPKSLKIEVMYPTFSSVDEWPPVFSLAPEKYPMAVSLRAKNHVVVEELLRAAVSLKQVRRLEVVEDGKPVDVVQSLESLLQTIKEIRSKPSWDRLLQ